jgi:hypothetical protein
MTTRRRFLAGSSALMGASSLNLLATRKALAQATGNDLKFIFVVNYGGWDPTQVFATEFDNPFVDMPTGVERGTVGNIDFVDHEDRPNVRSFFESYHQQCLLFNGVLVPSVAHENCLRISMCGSTSQERSDWPSILAGTAASDYALPQVVAGGPSFPGEFGAYVTRTGTGGQLEALLSGDIATWSDTPVSAFDWRSEAIMDRYIRGRSAAAADYGAEGRDAELKRAFDNAVDRSQYLKSLSNEVDWSGITSFAGQSELAADLLSLGVSRVATLGFSYYGWDTHIQNDTYQSINFNQLFGELLDLKEILAMRKSPSGASLADETVIVVLSEMGRTPQLNAGLGKDHWPYTSTMVLHPGRTEGRIIGGYDSYYYGKTIDLASGELAEDATNLAAETVGATLLAMADIDTETYTSGVDPVTAVL